MMAGIDNNPFNKKRTWGPTPNYPCVRGHIPKDRNFITIAGPCSIENAEQVEDVCKTLAKSPPSYMRGGVFRAGTQGPPMNYGLKWDLLSMWRDITKKFGLKIVVEVLDIRDIDGIVQYADAIQIGARQAQGYAILQEVRDYPGHVFLKNNTGMTLDEFLGAAEYLARGRCQPVLIERGHASIHNHTRWELSMSLIAAVKKLTNMPIIVDPSHGTGRRDLVEPMLYSGIAAGADGYLLEVHPDPEQSLSDPDQAYDLRGYIQLTRKARAVYDLVSRTGFPENIVPRY